MKSLRLKNTHVFREGYITFPSINKAKDFSRKLGGAGQVSVIHRFPTAYSVFALKAGEFPDDMELTYFAANFQAQLDQLEEMADKLAAVKS
jgi:hypothetical protein